MLWMELCEEGFRFVLVVGSGELKVEDDRR